MTQFYGVITFVSRFVHATIFTLKNQNVLLESGFMTFCCLKIVSWSVSVI